nr:MAG TPA: hypothetical protein [Caudoviricetes sp.]
MWLKIDNIKFDMSKINLKFVNRNKPHFRCLFLSSNI